MKITSNQIDVTLFFDGAKFAELESHLFDYGADSVETYGESATWEDSTVEKATISANGAIASYVEEMNDTLNERFNDDIAPSIIAEYDEDDSIALDQGFNDWTDSLYKDGEICESVYNNVGRVE